MKFKPSLHIYVDLDNVSLYNVLSAIDNICINYTLKSINLFGVSNVIDHSKLISRIECIKRYYNCEVNRFAVETGSNNADIKLASVCCVKHGRKSKSKIVIISCDNGFKELKSTLESIGKEVQIINDNKLKSLSNIDKFNICLRNCLLDMYVSTLKSLGQVYITTIESNSILSDEYNYSKMVILLKCSNSLCALLKSVGFIVNHITQEITGFNKSKLNE